MHLNIDSGLNSELVFVFDSYVYHSVSYGRASTHAYGPALGTRKQFGQL